MLKWTNGWIERLLPRFFSNDLIRRIARNSSIIFSATGIAAGLSMLQGILAARLLGVTLFGVLGAITVFASVVNKFASFRMSELVIKYVGEFQESGDQQKAAATFKAAGLTELVTSLFAFGLVWLLAPLGAQYFAKDISLAGWFALYGVVILANFMSESSTGLLQLFDRFRSIAALTIAQSLLTLTLITAAFLLKGGLLEVILAYLVGKAVGGLGLSLLALQAAQAGWGAAWWRAPLAALGSRRKEMTRFAVSTNLSASINLINKDSELLWINALRSPTEGGYYKLALALANLLLLPVSPLPQVTYPELSREVARESWSNVLYILKQGSRMAFAYTLLASVFLAGLGLPLIRWIYGTEYLPAYPALVILLVGFLVANTFYWNRTVLLALGHPDYPAKVNLLAALLKVVGILLLVPRFGYLGSAALLSGFYLLSISLNVWKARQVLAQKRGEME